MAEAHLRCVEIMNAFAYGFGMAIAIALTLAISNAWVNEHRNGVWTLGMIVGTGVVALVLGVTVGWALQQYLAFYAASATGRI